MTLKFRIVSAHFGSKRPWLQKIQSKHHTTQVFYDDLNMPGRENAMHPRLKSKIPKMLEWKTYKADWYIWMDSSVMIKKNIDIAEEVIKTAGEKHLCLFKHTKLTTITDEALVVKRRIKEGVKYFEDRFKGEPILSQVKHYRNDPSFVDNKLFQMTFFAYHYNARHLMRDWFIENCVWSIKDQLSFPYVLHKHRMPYATFSGNAINNSIFDWKWESREDLKNNSNQEKPAGT